MAPPQKEVCFLGSVQAHHAGWRAAVWKVGMGPTRVFHAEALEDLTLARQASSRDDMGRVLHRLVAKSDARSKAGKFNCQGLFRWHVCMKTARKNLGLPGNKCPKKGTPMYLECVRLMAEKI